jgi:hypothetical protein
MAVGLVLQGQTHVFTTEWHCKDQRPVNHDFRDRLWSVKPSHRHSRNLRTETLGSFSFPTRWQATARTHRHGLRRLQLYHGYAHHWRRLQVLTRFERGATLATEPEASP